MIQNQLSQTHDKPKRILLKHDGIVTISTGSSRKTKTWKQKQLSWSKLVSRLSDTKRTREKQSEYFRMAKQRQDDIKDVGGFVAGELLNGRRTAMTAGKRQIVTLDADFAPKDFWDYINMFFDNAICVYSTHKHTKDKPRLRLVIPLSRAVNPDEYQAVSRKIAENFGMDYFDDTTYEPVRLMYWPSTSIDGEFVFHFHDGDWINPNKVLAEYDDWQDQTTWPTSSRQKEIVQHAMKKQEDPLEKQGLIGLFCRTYTIQEAIDKFLPDVYEPCANHDNRYTYIKGTTTGGAIVYDDKFLYSHHSTDPATMKLCNAFDLVRIHKFGTLDEGKKEKKPSKMSSFQKMQEFVATDSKCTVKQIEERQTEVEEDFDDLGDGGEFIKQDLSWTNKLQRNKRTGKNLSTRYNLRLILEHDQRVAKTFGWDAFSQRIAILKKPFWRKKDEKEKYWTDRDDSELRYFFETYYEIDSKQKIEDATLTVAYENQFHRVRDWLNLLKWDGVNRMETLFIDYLGAEDTKYTRTVTRKMLIAAVGRIMQPGLKFDNMIVLEGPQGIGKSFILKKLGGQWFNDSLTSMGDKESMEMLRGGWIFEISELAAVKKSEIESIKQFISKQTDTYRVSYGKRVTEFPRQCVFIGTTNEHTFLRDQTGNRRFWPIRVGLQEPVRSLKASETDGYIQQVWAEALDAYRGGESVWLDKSIELEAIEIQKQHTEDNPYTGIIAEYLDRDLPANWYSLDLRTRRDYLANGFEDSDVQLVADRDTLFKRDKVCIAEIWCELLGGDLRRFSAYDRKELRTAMEQIPGWEKYTSESGNSSKLRFGNPYGRQNAYIRTGGHTNLAESDSVKNVQ